MVLSITNSPVNLVGTTELDLVAGDKIRIQKKQGENPVEDELYETVPEGKIWKVFLRVNIDQDDV